MMKSITDPRKGTKAHIAKACIGDAFWCKLPYYADSKKEAIDLIKKRMEILKNW